MDSMASERELLSQKNKELSTDAESLKTQLNEYNARLVQIFDSMASERELLNQKNKELSTDAESLKAQLNEYNARLVQIEGERVQNERVLQQCRTENIDLQSDLNDSKGRIHDLLRKIEDDTHLWNAEKNNLEGTVADLQTKHELMGSEMESLTQKNRALSIEVEFFKYQGNALESELNDPKKRTQELLQKRNRALSIEVEFFKYQGNALESELKDSKKRTQELIQKRNRALSIEVEFFKYQGNALESELNDSKKRTQELLQKNEDDQHLWDVKTTNFEGILAALQTERDLLAKERRSLTQKNRELSIEVEFLKYQVNEGVKQHSDLTQQYKVAEHSLKQQNETLQEKVNSTKCLFEKQNQRFAESTVKNGRLDEQVEELSKKFGGLHETNVKLVQEKDAQRMEFESLHAETAKKYKELQEESLKQTEEHGKMIESLQESFHEDLMV
jgi:chromosome segregation ATPase